jgi:uncharacterized membrane protein
MNGTRYRRKCIASEAETNDTGGAAVGDNIDETIIVMNSHEFVNIRCVILTDSDRYGRRTNQIAAAIVAFRVALICSVLSLRAAPTPFTPVNLDKLIESSNLIFLGELVVG